MEDYIEQRWGENVWDIFHWVHPFYFGISCHVTLPSLAFVFVLCFVWCFPLEHCLQTLLCHVISCSTSESLVSPVKQAPRKSPSDTEGLVNSVPIRSHQVNGIKLLWKLTWRPSRRQARWYPCCGGGRGVTCLCSYFKKKRLSPESGYKACSSSVLLKYADQFFEETEKISLVRRLKPFQTH